MTTTETSDALTRLFIERYRELIEGVPDDEPTWVTTGGRAGGLNGSIAGLSAQQASRDFAGTSIASHVEHVRWAIELANGYFRGDREQPSWSESWSVKTVDAEQWEALTAAVAAAANELFGHVERAQRWDDSLAATAAFASYGHTAYHLGAIRQLRKLALEPTAVTRGAGSVGGIGVVYARVQY